MPNAKAIILKHLLRTAGNYPVIQAPCAGVIKSEKQLAIVSKNGFLGSIGAGYMVPSELQSLIRSVKAVTAEPFSVNLMVPEIPNYDIDKIQNMLPKIGEICASLESSSPCIPAPVNDERFLAQVQVVIEEKVPVVSFVFGIPSQKVLNSLKSNGIILIGSATDLSEGLILEKSGFDAVVAQGIEAGGHRATFLSKQNSIPMLSTADLVAELAIKLSIPVIAAGGIVDGAGIVKMKNLGAAGVQLGTVFLTCYESDATDTYKEALLNEGLKATPTQLTRAFSGKYARGIKNSFMDMFEDEEIPDYPLQNTITTEMRKAAAKKGRSEFLSLWAGQGYAACKSESTDELIRRLKRECTELGLDL